MSASDLNVYRSCYCESCHQLRKNFGMVSASAVNYDMTFNSIILNSVSLNGTKDQNMRNGLICFFGRCTAHTELLKKIAGYTVLLTKWELEDDRDDHPTLRSNGARIALGRAIRKAERMYPEYDEHVGKGFDVLRETEEKECSDAVQIGRTFASSLVPAMKDIAGDAWSSYLENLFVSLGTLVYVMDAVDDLDEDYMNGTFNPFLTDLEGYFNGKRFIQNNLYEITDIFGSVMGDVQSSYSGVRGSMRFHHGVADNIVYNGLPDSVKMVVSGECCSRPGFMNTLSSHFSRKGER
jgi:hypothetical protein